ncbi:MAG: hypothetical protein ABIY52_09415 [Gemmatimonadaceae bacterium]
MPRLLGRPHALAHALALILAPCSSAVASGEQVAAGFGAVLVWQQQRSDVSSRGDFDARLDVGEIFRTVPTNVFLVKATYWIGR